MPLQHRINGGIRYRCAGCRWSYALEQDAILCESLHQERQQRAPAQQETAVDVDFTE
jgi:hypothetical protein